MSQSISNQTHACLFPSTPQRSEIVSTMGRPHPPLRSERGLGSGGILKPGPGSHTLPCTAPSETVTVSEIWSSAESPAWRMLLVTSSLTTSRTSSSFSDGKRSVSWSRAWRAVVTTSGSGANLRSISAIIKKPQGIGHDCKRYVPSVTCRYTSHGCAAALLAKTEAYTLDWLRLLATANYSNIGLQLTEVGMPDRSKQGSLSIHRQNETWLQEQTLAVSRSAIVITDPNEPGNPIVYANRTFERITGYGIEEVIGKNCRFLQGEDRDQPALEELRAAVREGRECQVLLRNYKKDGTFFWNELSISPVHDEEGNLANFVGVVGDVTERKRAEEALQYQLGLTRTITDNAADSLFLWDTEGRVTFMNPAAEQTFGWRQEELLGEVLHDRMHHHYPDGRPYPISECPLVKVFESGRTLHDHEDVFFRKDGSPIEVSCFLAPIIVDGEITGAVLVVRDITERKRVEKALREQTETLEKVNRIGRLLSSELDLQRLVQAVTDEATELTGAQFGAFFYNVVDDRGASYTLYTISGAPREAFSKFPMPRKTEIFGPTFEGEGVVRATDIREDPRYGNNPPYNGMPDGHLPVVSYLAVPVVSRSGEVLGGLFFGHPEAGVFGEREEQIAVGLAAQAAIAIDNARLFESMRESEDRLSLAVESTGFGTWDFDPLTGVLRWDDRCKVMFGLPPEAEVDYETFLEGLHPEDRQRTDRVVQRSLDPASGGGYDIEYRTVGIEDGVERWVSARGQAYFDEAGQAGRLTGTVLDITERKRAEEALRQSELLYHTVMKQATENIFLVDAETRRIVES